MTYLRPSADVMLTAEREVLGFLLDPSVPPETVREILGRLRSYAFQEVEHQVLFDCVVKLSLRPRGELLEYLPACLVRAGFPAIDLERFRGEHRMPPDQALRRCATLEPHHTP